MRLTRLEAGLRPPHNQNVAVDFGGVVRRWLGAFFAWLALGTGPAAAVEAPALRYLSEDHPPSNYLENGQTKGYAVDLLRLVWHRTGWPVAPIEVMPWARALELAEHGDNTVLFSVARNAEREARFQWAGPIATDYLHLIGLRKAGIQLTALADARHYRVGVVRSDVCVDKLAASGLNRVALVPAADTNVLASLLGKGRVDLICVGGQNLTRLARHVGVPAEDLLTYWRIPNIHLYFAFSRTTPPDIVARFQAALDALGEERKRLLKPYGLEP